MRPPAHFARLDADAAADCLRRTAAEADAGGGPRLALLSGLDRLGRTRAALRAAETAERGALCVYLHAELLPPGILARQWHAVLEKALQAAGREMPPGLAFARPSDALAALLRLSPSLGGRPVHVVVDH